MPIPPTPEQEQAAAERVRARYGKFGDLVIDLTNVVVDLELEPSLSAHQRSMLGALSGVLSAILDCHALSGLFPPDDDVMVVQARTVDAPAAPVWAGDLAGLVRQ